ncbi:metalloendopeptidase [Blastocladiella emersonii ATCC 22665]|nr:metalloendopeptidase [Blastocladiella emersonii ATCC 22665]
MTVPPTDYTPAAFTLETTADEIRARTSAITTLLRDACDAVAAVPAGERTLANTLDAFHAAQNRAAAQQVYCTFPSMVHADSAVRAAASQAKTELKDAFDASYAHAGVFAALEGVAGQVPKDEPVGNLYARTMALLRLSGMAIADEAKRAEYLALKSRIAALEQTYTQNINEDTTKFTARRADELAGLPDRFVAGLEDAGDGNVWITCKTPDYLAVMQSTECAALRKRCYLAYNSRCPQNERVLAEMLELRDRAAKLAGFKSHAHLKLASAMAKSPEALAFLDDLAAKLQPKRDADMRELQAVMETADPLAPWDFAFATSKLKRTKYAVDDNYVAQFFPLTHVWDAVFALYSDLFSIVIVEAPDMPKWHEDVRAFAVYDRSTPENGARGELMGHIYLDLHPRAGKYAHQCVPPLMPMTSNGGEGGAATKPIAGYIGNLTKPTPGNPSYLRFTEARTAYHETGHLVHQLRTRSSTALFSWSWSLNPYPGGVEVDFLELPSIMFENWLYDPRVIHRIAQPHPVTGEAIPEATIRTLGALRTLGAGLAYTRQLYMTLFDLAIHLPGFVVDGEDTAAKLAPKWADLQRRIHGTEFVPGTHPWTAWYHLAGYDAVYNSYLSSEVFAHDCFTKFAEADGGCLNKDVAAKFAKAMLEPGASVDGMSMLRSFLGREPENGPFLRHVLG